MVQESVKNLDKLTVMFANDGIAQVSHVLDYSEDVLKMLT